MTYQIHIVDDTMVGEKKMKVADGNGDYVRLGYLNDVEEAGFWGQGGESRVRGCCSFCWWMKAVFFCVFVLVTAAYFFIWGGPFLINKIKMEASASLVAGSHNKNELIVICREGESDPKPLQQMSGQIYRICGDDVRLTVDGELFVACNECAFPVCRTCYEYERREGNQVCPQCKTRFKHLKGCD